MRGIVAGLYLGGAECRDLPATGTVSVTVSVSAGEVRLRSVQCGCVVLSVSEGEVFQLCFICGGAGGAAAGIARRSFGGGSARGGGAGAAALALPLPARHHQHHHVLRRFNKPALLDWH